MVISQLVGAHMRHILMTLYVYIRRPRYAKAITARRYNYDCDVMKLLLLFLLVCLVAPSVEWRWRRRWIRIRWRRVATAAAVAAFGKRDIETFDLNKDGYVDQSEAEKQLSTRDAETLMKMADEEVDGRSAVSVNEFERYLQDVQQGPVN